MIMMKRVLIFALTSMMLAACANKGVSSDSPSSSESDETGTFEEVVALMTEYSKLGSFRDAIIDETFKDGEKRDYEHMSQEERAKFSVEVDKKMDESKAIASARGEEIKERLNYLVQELSDKSINTEPDLNVPLEVVKPFHITKLTPDRAAIECTAKVLIDRVIKDESLRQSNLNYDFCVSAYAEDAKGNGIVNEFRLKSKEIDDYQNELTAGSEVTLTFTTHPGFNQESILLASKIVLLWPAPIDDIDDEMGAEEDSEID